MISAIQRVRRPWTDMEWGQWAKFAILGFVVSAVGYGVLGIAFAAFLDICDAGHESPNNAGGWSIAAATMVATAILGRWLRPPLWLLWVGVGVALQALVFTWAILPAGTC